MKQLVACMLLLVSAVASPALGSGRPWMPDMARFRVSRWLEILPERLTGVLNAEQLMLVKGGYQMTLPAYRNAGQLNRAIIGPDRAGVDKVALKPLYEAAEHKWRVAVADYLKSLCDLPIGIRVVVEDGAARFERTPEIPRLYAGLSVQPILIHVRHAEATGYTDHHDMGIDLAAAATIRVLAHSDRPQFYLLNLAHLPPGTNTYALAVHDDLGNDCGTLDFELTGRPTGMLKVELVDAAGTPAPARVGVYSDAAGFMRPANALTLFVHDWEEYHRKHNDPTWPVKDSRIFYTSGSLEMAVPPGPCRLVAAKGIEFRRHDETLDIKAGETISRRVVLERWVDMPAEGWYSGDDHCHVRRDGVTDHTILQWTKAEDVHVSNIVQMGDINRLYFLQYAWGDEGMAVDGDYVLRTGQEDPRTFVNGHTLMFNLTNAIHDRDSYYIYSDALDAAHRMGGMAGYAHWGSFAGAERGMSIDVPLGKADFVEVLHFYKMNTDVLYQFWNLGFKVIPTAGSDFPWGASVGVGRVFVHVDGPFSFDAWYRGLQAGHTIVSDGPILDFTVNDRLPGSEISLSGPGRLRVRAVARMNPSLGKLQRLELVRFGEVIEHVEHSGADQLQLAVDLAVEDSQWLAARAFADGTQAHSGAIYVTIDGRSFCDREQLPTALARVRGQLAEFEQEMDADDADAILRANAPRLKELIGQARAVYDQIEADTAQEQ